MNINIQLVRPNAKVPVYGSSLAAGADLHACLDKSVAIWPGATIPIPTGIAMEIPEGYVGLIYARSGLACKSDLAPANKVGVIDADYRGEILVALRNHGKIIRYIEPEDRIAQLVIAPVIQGEFHVVDSLGNTRRGTGGFGSTGK